MVSVVYFFALVMTLGGGYIAITGAEVILTERGWSHLIAGSVIGTGGMLLFGIGCLLLTLQRLARTRPAPTLAIEEPPVETGQVTAHTADPILETQAARSDLDEDQQSKPAPGAPAEDPAPEPRAVVGSYASGGITYFMYSDSSIEAEMEIGRYRFADMDALRNFIETGQGGEKLPTEISPAQA
jgi:hypothetical protein